MRTRGVIGCHRLLTVQMGIARLDAMAALSSFGDLIRTGPTGTNVSDIRVMAIVATDGRAGAPG